GLQVKDGERLHGSFAFPIRFQNEVLGVFEFFSHDVRQPDHDLLEMFTAAGSQIGQFLERKRTEEEIRQSALIVESSDDAIIGQSLDGIVVSWNRGATKIFGHSAAEVKGRSLALLIPPERSGEMEQILEKIKRGEALDHYETVRRRKDGKDIDV